MHDLTIIGGGAAGLAAGLYAARFKLDAVVVAREVGGTGNIAHKVDNWIGEPGIVGFDLMQKFIEHVQSYKVPIVAAVAMSVRKKNGGFSVLLDNGTTTESKMVLFANGMEHRKLNVPGETEYTGRGVHYCYTCDGPFYKNKIIAVVGGSDSAAQAALFLTTYGNKVHMIIRNNKLTAEPITTDAVASHAQIECMPHSTVADIIGSSGRVTQLKLNSGKMLDVNGIFVEIGHMPLSNMAQQLGVEVDHEGFIIVNRNQETNVASVLAAGDITNATTLKQFITSAAEGSIAAQTAYKTLQAKL